jgi:hypothetical protein
MSGGVAGCGTSVLPLPLISSPFQPHSRSRRLAQRFSRAAATTSIANRSISALNLLSTSFADHFDHSSTRARNPPLLPPFSSLLAADPTPTSTPTSAARPSSSSTVPSAAQSRALAHVYRCAQRFVSRRASAEAECDDPFFDINFLSQQLQQSDLDSYLPRNSQMVVPLIADRISLPSSAGSVDLLSLLPPSHTQLYSDPSALLLPPHQRSKAPRTALLAAPDEWLKLVRRLFALGMVEFTDQPKVVCGVFAVPKSDSTDRLIIDARPANVVFADPEPVRLPTPDLLARLCTDGTRPFFVAKVDLDNYYHRLRLPVWMRPYFALPAVRAGDVSVEVSARFGADCRVFPCCVTLPMGWSHSVLVAQLAHEHLLNTRTPLCPGDRITHDTDSLVDRPRHQVYIDDVNFIGTDRDAVRRAQSEYIEAVQAVGLVVKPSKVVLPSCEGVECLGLEVHGADHTVGVSACKLARLCRDTQRVLARGSCSGFDLSHLVGRWTWACLACRPALSVFSAVYRFVECAGRRVFTVWRSVARELHVVCALAPLLFSNTAAGWFERVVASDASSVGLGVVATSDEPLIPHAAVVSPEEAAAVAESCNWHTIASSRWREEEHIKVLELRALSTAVRWVMSFRSAVGKRVLVLSDSHVVVGAVTKGRSSSPQLLRRLRALTALLLAGGIRLSLRWVPSELNPADEPSRRF